MSIWWLLLLLNVSLACLGPWVFGKLGLFQTASQQVLYGFLQFLALAFLEISYNLRNLLVEKNREQQMLKQQMEFDAGLANLQRCYRDLLRRGAGQRDLFVEYFTRHVRVLEDRMCDASEKGELDFDDNYVEAADCVLSVFDGGSEAEFREIWDVSDSTINMHNSTQYWFRKCANLSNNSKVRTKTLLILSPEMDVQAGNLGDFLRYLVNVQNRECKVIARDVFKDFAADFHMGKEVDFGIYGHRYLFRTLDYGKHNEHVMGRFSMNRREIERYITFFDKVWETDLARPPQEAFQGKLDLSKAVLIDELFRGQIMLPSAPRSAK